jgi:hypothetical protein
VNSLDMCPFARSQPVGRRAVFGVSGRLVSLRKLDDTFLDVKSTSDSLVQRIPAGGVVVKEL